nr:hypothetical protein OG999_20820 [Streptomyces sp. NBC_00886]
MIVFVGAWFSICGLIFTFNPMGLGEKIIRQNFRAGGVPMKVNARYLARRLGIMFLLVGGGILAAGTLLALGVDKGVLMSLLPVGVLALFVIVGSTIYGIYRASSRRNGS